MWTADEVPARLVYVGKARIHVSIEESLLEALRARATKMRCHQSDVITQALSRELSLELFDQTVEGRLEVVEAQPSSLGAENGHPAAERKSQPSAIGQVEEPTPAAR